MKSFGAHEDDDGGHDDYMGGVKDLMPMSDQTDLPYLSDLPALQDLPDLPNQMFPRDLSDLGDLSPLRPGRPATCDFCLCTISVPGSKLNMSKVLVLGMSILLVI